MANSKRDPLRHIPSAAVIRRRIAELKKQATRYGILLRTAEELERSELSRGDQTQSPHASTQK